MLLGDVLDQLRNAFDALSRERRRIENGSILEKSELLTQIVGKPERRLIIFFGENIPFIDDDDDALARLMYVSRDLRILLEDPLGGIDDHEHDARTVDGTQRPHDAVALDGQRDLALAPHSRRINEQILRTVPCEMRVDGVACRPRHIADNDAFLAEQAIDQRRLPHVRTPHNGDRDLIRLALLRLLCPERRHNGVEEVAEIHRVRRGNGNRVAKPERIEIID